MWKLNNPQPVKLIVGILAAGRESETDTDCLKAALAAVEKTYGRIDMQSEVFPFTQTEYYKGQTGESIIRQFATIEKLVDPGKLASFKHKSNRLEQKLAKDLSTGLYRPVNLDPGIIEPSKLILATTKNFAHRIYIGDKMYAEVTLSYHKGQWVSFDFTFPDYKQQCYHDFFSRVRERLVEQLRNRR